jgi:hypothetical protein
MLMGCEGLLTMPEASAGKLIGCWISCPDIPQMRCWISWTGPEADLIWLLSQYPFWRTHPASMSMLKIKPAFKRMSISLWLDLVLVLELPLAMSALLTLCEIPTGSIRLTAKSVEVLFIRVGAFLLLVFQ